jgi:hypothetical protein
MTVEMVDIKDVLLNDSFFSLQDYILESSAEPSCQLSSFHSLGILYPIIVYRDRKKQLHLIDGVKRIQHAKVIQQKKINAMILPEKTPVTDIISLILCNKRHEIESSIINKVQSICFAISLNAPDSWIMDSLCFSFDFKPHSEFLRECERIYNLPREIKQFCHDKKISLKQIINFTYYPRELLETLIEWKSVLQLTASTLDEIASNINDYMKRENKKVDDLLAEPEVQEIFDSSLGPREKTEQFRRILYLKKFPLLSSSNSRIEDFVKSVNLPREVKINWDRTLENKKLDIDILINDPLKWSAILKTLQSDELKGAIESILEEL